MSRNPSSNDAGPLPTGPRPYVVSGGRTTAAHVDVLDLMAYVTVTNEAANLSDLTPQHQRVLEVCRAESAVTVGDVVVEVPYPLQVARILISDLIEKRALVHRLTVVVGEPPPTELLQRVQRALNNWDVSDQPMADGKSPHAC
ncbi:DUF742 domain-containing protein [Streptomyces cellulosae]|uniref:DUF742 domain-containing protein n=1 Tax=Streptomyces althioticus TaxID=83380 RepID=A0ABZ1YJ96_9ACTN|nr:DUF742 domain-containing protein [Streptomyces cellulosae]WTB93368.1 DUF742 domain-containing protein [Streptomyces cellulosae]WTC60760.1 DUF742 domain-containing protein [Streptomyces cellulosae]